MEHIERLQSSDKCSIKLVHDKTLYNTFLENFSKTKSSLKEKIRLMKKAQVLGFSFAVKRIALCAIHEHFRNMEGGHTSYRNDAFYMAYQCGLYTVHKYGAGLIKNGILGYFERITHQDLPLWELLYQIDLVNTNNLEPKLGYDKDGGYYHLPPETIYKIAKLCKIPKVEVDWIAFKICFALASTETCHPEGEFDLDCTAPINSEFIIGIAEKFLPDKMKNFLYDYCKIRIPDVI